LEPARVIEEHRGRYLVACASGEISAECSGQFRQMNPRIEDRPAVGDWVAIDAAAAGKQSTIQALLPRRTLLARSASAGAAGQQLIAANVDTVLIVCSLDHDFNLRRLERYLVFVAGSGAAGIIVLNKSDLHDQPQEALAQTRAIAGETPVILISAQTGSGIPQLLEHLRPGGSYVLVGSSGAGKSTLVNALLGSSRQQTLPVRDKDHGGQHTTTSRVLLTHDDGWVVLDTPGIRELGVLADEQALDAGFPDIVRLASSCRFRDCQHQGEPGCAIADAVDGQDLDPGRLANYLKLSREMASHERHHAHKARSMARSQIRQLQRKRTLQSRRLRTDWDVDDPPDPA
jgi:ribosome biogenesis GTPase